ncbi:MAG TPA: SDR family NAD(P)-dependent oxidoreductase, partial [Hyphomicrobiales bacterium]|nr:SDR family NAD(P)-dependent oxidoreductase [Hyphomicrobiales bacterium]
MLHAKRAPIADAAAGIRHVFVRDMAIETEIGVHPNEKYQAQRIIINVDLAVAETSVMETDRYSDVVCYENVVKRVRAFAAEGAKVLVADINQSAADAVAAEIGGIASATNVADAGDIGKMLALAIDRFGHIDIVVNNAGVTHLPAPMESISEQDFDRVLAVNVKPIYLIARELIPLMKKQGSGNILNVASTAGLSPRPNLSWYNASKGWVITASKSMAVELAPFGIRVNAICPVAGETP